MPSPPNPPMTRAERAVWTAVYAAVVADRGANDAATAAYRARQAVDALRRLAVLPAVQDGDQIKRDAAEIIFGRKGPT